jgi:hypothetical protein
MQVIANGILSAYTISTRIKYSATDNGHVEPIDDPKSGGVKGPSPSLLRGASGPPSSF